MELLGGHVDAAAGGDDDADGLVDGVDAVEDVVGAGAVGRGVDGGDAEDVDGVDEAVDEAVLALGADGELAAGGGEGVVAEGGFVGNWRWGFVVGGGEGEAGLAEGGEGGEGAGGGEPLAGLEKDVGAVRRLEGEGEARHGLVGEIKKSEDGCVDPPSVLRSES